MSTLTAIILVDYYGYEETVECVNSLRKMRDKDYVIIIVDNTPNSKHKLSQDDYLTKYADVIETNENLGFSGGNNVGIRYAFEKYQPEFILLLNNDTLVHTDLLTELKKGYYSENRIGLVTSKIFMYPQKEFLWYCGGSFNCNDCIPSMGAYGQKDTGEYDNPSFVSFATGCVMLINRSIIEKIGYLSEDYFLYFEDTDYCIKLLKAGYKLLYYPSAIIYHKESVSTGKNNPRHHYYLIRNNLYIIKRYGQNKSKAYISLFYRTLKDIIRKRKRFIDCFRSWRDFLLNKNGKNSKYSK